MTRKINKKRGDNPEKMDEIPKKKSKSRNARIFNGKNEKFPIKMD
jgi:hypothetical protein